MLRNVVGLADRDARPGKILSLFLWAAIHNVFDEVGADTAIIQQCVSFRRSAVGSDSFAFATRNEEGTTLSIWYQSPAAQTRRTHRGDRGRAQPLRASKSATLAERGFDESLACRA